MSTQNTFVDYTNLGDTGTDTASAIQPLEAGEAASAPNLNRAAENLRSRTEIARGVTEDLLYYRDAAAARYLIDVSGGGLLSWEVGGGGRVNNTTALSLRPFVGPRDNEKGSLLVGTGASNQVRYFVDATAYAADGMNAITVEHRSVTGTVTPVVTISAGPVKHILVVFDSANTGHDASTVSALLSAAIAGDTFLAGQMTIATSAVPAVAILATAGRVAINIRTHSGGLAGNASVDLEEHTLAAGALGTFTTTTPLTEGDLLAIRYDYVAEDGGTGGRAQSVVARGSADVAANLFVAQEYPEWLPGCVPLCKVLHGRLVWVDGTILASGSSMTPGSTYTTYFDPSAFSGLPTQVVNGGIDTAASTLAAALVSVDSRLSQSRYATWTVTDGTNSTGGHYNGAGAVNAAVAAATDGGDIFVRRGVYTSALPAITVTSGGLKLRGETHDGTLTSRTRMTAASSTTVTSDVTLESLAYLRTGAFTTTLVRNTLLKDVAFQAGALHVVAPTYSARLDNVTMLNSISTGDHTTSSLRLSARRVHVTNSRFTGPDPLCTGDQPVVWQSTVCSETLYENCAFTSTRVNSLAFAFENSVGITTFNNCTFSAGSPGGYVIDFDGLSLGGTVRFVNCRFVNTGGFAVVRARPVTGTVVFEDCLLYAVGSPNGIAVGAQCVAVFAPLAAAKVVVKSCSATVQETDFTGILRPLVNMGGSETGTCEGALSVKGFDLVLAGVSTELPASACVWLRGEESCMYENVTVDVAGKRAPAVTNTTGDGGPGYVFAGFGSSSSRPLRLRNFAVYNADSPSVTATATCVAGWLYLSRCALDGFITSTVAVPSANTFRCSQVHLFGSSVQNAHMQLFSTHTAFATIRLESIDGGQLSLFTRSKLVGAAVAGGVALGHLFYLDGATVREVTLRDSSLLSCDYVFLSFDANATHNTFDANDIRLSTLTSFFTTAFSANSNGLCVTNNDITTALAAGAFFNAAGALDGYRMVGNRFMTTGATAAGCTPNPSTVVATALTAISNNTFSVTLITPS